MKASQKSPDEGKRPQSINAHATGSIGVARCAAPLSVVPDDRELQPGAEVISETFLLLCPLAYPKFFFKFGEFAVEPPG